MLGAVLDWKQLAMLVSVAPLMLFVTVIYIPETPSFLMLKGRDEDAYRWVFNLDIVQDIYLVM
jgi:facilitated trehalose transporter